MPTAKDVAEWMVEELQGDRLGTLIQEDAALDIEKKFGSEFTYLTDYGNSAIRRDVLREFRKLTKDWVVWDGGEKAWRKRERYDSPGRRQD
ncbi:MAG: DUF6953 family protein [Terriglobales bacterium]